MKNDELDRLLRSVPVPGRPREEWDALERRILARVQWPASESPSRPMRPWRLLPFAWAVGAALVMFMLLGLPQPRKVARTNDISAEDAAAYAAQLIRLFPDRLETIRFDRDGPNLELKDRPGQRSSAPVFVKVCDGRDCASFVTFSGNKIEAAGQRWEVLLDADGGVLLVGGKSVWSSGQPDSVSGLRFEVRTLKAL